MWNSVFPISVVHSHQIKSLSIEPTHANLIRHNLGKNLWIGNIFHIKRTSKSRGAGLVYWQIFHLPTETLWVLFHLKSTASHLRIVDLIWFAPTPMLSIDINISPSHFLESFVLKYFVHYIINLMKIKF